mmetsp:Transcript_15750/g.21605  ORF Transcript_15750/g.21605 Transcript_15750/m.21605 type:complete len:532 (-) Transcript_15750:212-1807(-)
MRARIVPTIETSVPTVPTLLRFFYTVLPALLILIAHIESPNVDAYTTSTHVSKHKSLVQRLLVASTPDDISKIIGTNDKKSTSITPSEVAIPSPYPTPERSTITSDYAGTKLAKEEAAFAPYLIHSGRSVDMIRRSPALGGVSLCKGWSRISTEAFKVAVEAVVRANPILSGRVYETKEWGRTKELWIQPGTFPPSEHEYVTEIQPPPDLVSPATLSGKDALSYVKERIIPHMNGVKADMTYHQIRSKSPLFSAQIMELPDGYACYTLTMSHSVGDGYTFFELVGQIASYMNGRDASPIDWDDPRKATHELYPDSFSRRDIERSYGTPFLLGCLKNYPTLQQRQCNYLLLSKDKIAHKRQEIRSNGINSVSGNDIMTSALCEMNKSSDIFVMTQNMRGKETVEGVGNDGSRMLHHQTGGNLFREVPFLRTACTDPKEVRNLLGQGKYFEPNELPLAPFLLGRVGRITSLASVTQKILFPGTEVVCQFPFISFIKDLPIDVAVIFRVNDEYWGVLHNFSKVGKSPLLDEIRA